MALVRQTSPSHSSSSKKNNSKGFSPSSSSPSDAVVASVKKFKLSDLTNSKLNLLRLLLVWTSNGNFLAFKNNKMERTVKYNEARVMSPEISERHLRDIFPPVDEVKWSLEKVAMKQFKEYCMMVNETTNPFQLLRNILNFAVEKHTADATGEEDDDEMEERNERWDLVHSLPYVSMISHQGRDGHVVVVAIPMFTFLVEDLEDKLNSIYDLTHMQNITLTHKVIVKHSWINMIPEVILCKVSQLLNPSVCVCVCVCVCMCVCVFKLFI